MLYALHALHARLKRNPWAVVLERFCTGTTPANPRYRLPKMLVLVLLYSCETHSRPLPFSCRQVLPEFWWARPVGILIKGRFSTEKHRSV